MSLGYALFSAVLFVVAWCNSDVRGVRHGKN